MKKKDRPNPTPAPPEKIYQGNMPAFPVKEFPTEIDKKKRVKTVKDFTGMSLRDYFAAKVMQGLIEYYMKTAYDAKFNIAERAYEIADAMIEERGR